VNHELKCRQPYYQQVLGGSKRFELRKNDRNFQPGDSVMLIEVVPCICGEWVITGRRESVIINDVLTETDVEGLAKGYCIFYWGNLAGLAGM